ncbi:MAG: amidohydrolase [Spirochaetaceae bacterium]|nr:amidohydrolase [Spirochaetaceae bacterium]
MKTLVYNAKVYLRRGTFAEAVLVDGETIALTGTNADVLEAAPAGTRKIDAGGRLLLPGFYDSHLHLHELGRFERQINCGGVACIDEIVERGRAFIEKHHVPPGAMVMGFGLDQDLFTQCEKRYPTRADLDRISTAHPVILLRVCGHVALCNSRALERAGIADRVPVIEGGIVETGDDGKPNGVLKENAASLARTLFPKPTPGDLVLRLEAAMKTALSYGVTSAASHDTMGPDFPEMKAAFTHVLRERHAPLRIVMQCGSAEKDRYLNIYKEEKIVTGTVFIKDYLKMGPLKLFADGSLGSHTAALRSPYHDSPGTTGVPAMEGAVLQELVRKADAAGFQTAIHAIGDAAIENVIEAYEALPPDSSRRRHGVIHCQITDGGLLDRMAGRDIVAVVQPVFLAHDLYIAEKRLGAARAATSYAWGSMERRGVRSAYGTDCPIEHVNPMLGIAAAVTRQDSAKGYPPGGFYPDERIDVAAAVDNYTAGSAWANFDETRLGRIKEGYLADMVLWDTDIFTCPPEMIGKTKTLWTMSGGELCG